MRSGTIRVLKRDGSGELFNAQKLAGTLFRAMKNSGGKFSDASDLAQVIEIYLKRKGTSVISSAAVFEMGLKVLSGVSFAAAAHLLETHRSWRNSKRRAIRIVHETGAETVWEKGWAAKLACSHFDLAPQTARILAGIVETKILTADIRKIDRNQIIFQLAAAADSFGLSEQQVTA